MENALMQQQPSHMGKIQKMLKMPTDTFNNKETTRNAGVAAVPETEVDSVFSLETYIPSGEITRNPGPAKAQPRHLLTHLQLDRRSALRVLTQTRPRTLLHLPSRAGNEQSRSLKFHNHRENAPTKAFFRLSAHYIEE